MSSISLSPAAIASYENELHQLQITACIATAALGMYIWDICTNIRDEYRLLLKGKSFPTFVYFAARLSSLSFLLCHTLSHIYYNDRWVVAIFFTLWLGNVACASVSTLIYGKTATLDFGGTVSCIEENIKIRYASVTVIGALVHDTCVFSAISYRLFKNSQPLYNESIGLQTTTEKYILGKHLPRFSRALFQDGQMLYLITLIASASTTITLYIPSIPMAYRLIADVPQIAILSALACAVFRNLRLGKFSDEELQTTSSSDLPWHAATGADLNNGTRISVLPAIDLETDTKRK
ncbi:hypothetical protein K435DRAFT_795960 [Dendrothele bispora CBS 962.96]|uniref:Uncharacterized protein n=1 Tax=Dendrothele bispora (strain CBS 962.96) TaxID=1314807 RepID=A0A4S8M765_DENBC|nr:hypothetical protein K435DRAFT_795960 [Dendrothele bispora CBS 962.96]